VGEHRGAARLITTNLVERSIIPDRCRDSGHTEAQWAAGAEGPGLSARARPPQRAATRRNRRATATVARFPGMTGRVEVGVV